MSMKGVEFLENYKKELENAANFSAEKMTNVLSKYISLLEKIDSDESLDIDKVIETFYDIWNSVSPKYNEVVQNNETKKQVPFFKKPKIPFSVFREVTKVQNLLEQKQKIIKKQNEIKKMFMSKLPINEEVYNHLYNVLYPERIECSYDNIKRLIDWINNLNGKTNKMLLYRSVDVDGAPKGGNGKSFIVESVLKAAKNLEIPATPTAMPGWYDSEVTEDYAENYLGISEEAHPNFRRDPGYDILDKNAYTIKRKYEKSFFAKSIINIIGTTNENISKLEQTTRRRIDLIECNEKFSALEYIKNGGTLPTEEEIVKSWEYLFTHDLKSLKLHSLTKEGEPQRAVPQDVLNIIWKVQDITIFQKKEMYLSEIKDLLEEKFSYSTIYDALSYFGATIKKKGNHGDRLDGSTLIDMSNYNVSDEIWGGSSQNLEKIKETIKKIVILPENNPINPTPTDDDFKGFDEALEEIAKKEDDTGAVYSELEKMLGEKKEVVEKKIYNYIEPNNIVYKDFYSTGVITKNLNDKSQFETINPIKVTTIAEERGTTKEDAYKFELVPHIKKREDKNVTSMRNFLFECDEISLKEQLEITKKLAKKGIINRVVFSGNKSLHCRITINQEPESIEHYKWLWHKLNNEFFSLAADKACTNPSRFTRKPNGVRKINGKEVIQKLIFKKDNILDVTNLEEEWKNYKIFSNLDKKLCYKKYEKPIPQFTNIVEELERIENKYGEREIWQKAYSLATNDGTLSYQDAASATMFIMSIGFTAKNCFEQIEYGNWNFTKKYLEFLEENTNK